MQDAVIVSAVVAVNASPVHAVVVAHAQVHHHGQHADKVQPDVKRDQIDRLVAPLHAVVRLEIDKDDRERVARRGRDA